MAGWGWVGDDELAEVVVVSPHPDDAVLSCGQFLAAHPGATVVTVFAGAPDTYPDPPSWWSTICGFDAGDDITAARRAEDAEALGTLDATPVWLDFLEAQFVPDGRVAEASAIADQLESTLRELQPTLVLLPLGLANPEHVATHDAVLEVRTRWSANDRAPTWLAYEDIAYKHIPGQLAWRITKLFRSSVWPTPVALPVDPTTDRKLAALACYPSQMRGLETDWRLQARLDAPTPEQYWRLEAPPDGWEAMIELA